MILIILNEFIKLFLKKILLSFKTSNDIFLRIHETTNTVSVPKGIKRVGVMLLLNEIYGYSVMITQDMFSNMILTPVINIT